MILQKDLKQYDKNNGADNIRPAACQKSPAESWTFSSIHGS
jgi:hypothetical protein